METIVVSVGLWWLVGNGAWWYGTTRDCAGSIFRMDSLISWETPRQRLCIEAMERGGCRKKLGVLLGVPVIRIIYWGLQSGVQYMDTTMYLNSTKRAD